jgi:low affinity Fe/Cu permease
LEAGVEGKLRGTQAVFENASSPSKVARSIEGGMMRSGLPVNAYGASPENGRQGWFRRLAIKTAEICGKPVTFAAAVFIVAVWGVTGPMFHFSDTWQLVINTGTTIVTFLMVFLIQATQNRDTTAIQLKLDELIIATKTARDRIAAAEDLSDEELEALKEQIKLRKNREPDDPEPA